MKAKNLGRLELLSWLNELVECDYPRIEMASDGIAYCQILDAVQPGSVPLHKLNFNAKNKDDYARNLKFFDGQVKKLRLPHEVNVNMLANGKFQYNMECIQWLYDYLNKTAPKAGLFYNGFERRLDAYKKQ